MLKIVNIFAAAILLVGMASCSKRQSTDTQTPNPTTPQALQEDKGSLNIKSGRSLFRGSGGRSQSRLLDDLYDELVTKTPELQKLEDDLVNYNEMLYPLEEAYAAYNGNSTQYYHLANEKANGITDSLFKVKINAIIAASSEKYLNKTADLKSLLSQIDRNKTSLDDYYIAMKIILTLPMIETYQDNEKPDQKPYRDLIQLQEDLIKRMLGFIPAVR